MKEFGGILMKKKLIALALVVSLFFYLLPGCVFNEKPSKMEIPPISVLELVDYTISGNIKHGKLWDHYYKYESLVYKHRSINVKCYGTASEAIDNPQKMGLMDLKYYSGLGYCFKELDIQLLLKHVTKVKQVTPKIITGPDTATMKVHTKLEIDDIYRSTISIKVPDGSSSLYKVLFEVTYKQEDSLEHCFFAISFYEPK